MDCVYKDYNNTQEFLQIFSEKTIQHRIPISGSLGLTHRCNLRCTHCYLGPQKAQHKLRPHELSTKKIHSLLDEITAAGCLFLLITGGEPLLRKDFAEIYTHAKENGLLVTVFSNGTMISEEILALFVHLPPNTVEITLYGASDNTYETITGVGDSFSRCLNGIQRLLDHNIHVKLKTILMTHNRHEFQEIKKIAEDFGVDFRFDADIFPRMDGDSSPISLRLSPEEAIEIELEEPGWAEELCNFYHKFQGAPQTDSLYQCGAGVTTFHIDPFGHLQPCLMTSKYQFDLSTHSFLEGWQSAVPLIRDRKSTNGSSCLTCESRTLCGYCPAFFDMENGSEQEKSDYLCTMGHLRFQAIKPLSKRLV